MVTPGRFAARNHVVRGLALRPRMQRASYGPGRGHRGGSTRKRLPRKLEARRARPRRCLVLPITVQEETEPVIFGVRQPYGSFDPVRSHLHWLLSPWKDAAATGRLKGKRVLVVGIGNSAVDIACELSNRGLAERLVLSTRRGAYVVPKYLFGRPIDQVVETNPFIPLALQRKAASWLIRLAVGRVEDFGMPTPDHELLTAHPTVSSDLLQRVGNGDITVKPNVSELRGDRVEFTDGTVEPFDAIIYATGYNITFPFFDPGFLSAPDNALPLFKRVFVPGVDNLMFVGFAQAIPSIIGFVQDQAKWVASYLAGEYSLPSPDEMRAAIKRDEHRMMSHYVASSRHTMQVDHVLYARDLQKEWKRGRRRAPASSCNRCDTRTYTTERPAMRARAPSAQARYVLPTPGGPLITTLPPSSTQSARAKRSSADRASPRAWS